MHAEKQSHIIITGDFNCRPTQRWDDNAENYEGKLLEAITAEIGLHQMISEQTHLMDNSKSCIE